MNPQCKPYIFRYLLSIDTSATVTRHIIGYKQEESDFLLKFLYDHIALSQDLQVRVKWAPRTVVVWDVSISLCYSSRTVADVVGCRTALRLILPRSTGRTASVVIWQGLLRRRNVQRRLHSTLIRRRVASRPRTSRMGRTESRPRVDRWPFIMVASRSEPSRHEHDAGPKSTRFLSNVSNGQAPPLGSASGHRRCCCSWLHTNSVSGFGRSFISSRDREAIDFGRVATMLVASSCI